MRKKTEEHLKTEANGHDFNIKWPFTKGMP